MDTMGPCLSPYQHVTVAFYICLVTDHPPHQNVKFCKGSDLSVLAHMASHAECHAWHLGYPQSRFARLCTWPRAWEVEQAASLGGWRVAEADRWSMQRQKPSQGVGECEAGSEPREGAWPVTHHGGARERMSRVTSHNDSNKSGDGRWGR